MQKISIILCLFLLACGSKKESESSQTQKKEHVPVSNFAVVWKWATSDVDLIRESAITISEETTALWKKGALENAYYSSDSEIDKLENLPNIAFFLKSSSEEEARSTLNNLTIVKKGIASYQLKPVGTLWLKRKADAIAERGLTQSYVAVWTTSTQKTPSFELIKEQNDRTLEYWNEGAIENVYFDIEGTQTANSTTDFVFFINTNSKDDAVAICNNLPFSKENIATYELHSAGLFWLGIYK